MATLRTLLQVTPDQIGNTPQAFQAHFARLAALLLNSVCLVVNQQARFRLVEVEFYLNSTPLHPDTFTHTFKDRLAAAEWQFHKQRDGFKGGSYKGLDITFATSEVRETAWGTRVNGGKWYGCSWGGDCPSDPGGA